MKKLFLLLLATVGILAVACNNEAPITPTIRVEQNTVNAWYTADTYTINIKSNCGWGATTNCEWITLVDTEGAKGSCDLKFSVLENKSSEERTATITIYAKGYEDVFETLTINQTILLDDYFKITYTSTDNDIVTP